MVNSVPNISLPNLSYLKSFTGKTSLPVDPSALVYANFQHVQGTPAPEGTQGVSISKLNLLDALINQIGILKPNSGTQSEINNFAGPDALIESLVKQVGELNTAGKASPYNPPAQNTEGSILFNILA